MSEKQLNKRIEEAVAVLTALDLPKQQRNQCSALTLLALLDLRPQQSWEALKRPLMGVTPIMEWMEKYYQISYAPNTRETIRRQTLHQFVAAGICRLNPDQHNRAVNSPKTCYQISEPVSALLKNYKTPKWKETLKSFLEEKESLAERYAQKRAMQRIPVQITEGWKHELSPGTHSELIKDIVEDFGPRFAPNAQVLYIGDTAAKSDFYEEESFRQLGLQLNTRGQLPDIILFWEEKKWLFLIEAVTSHGPIDAKRYQELQALFSNEKADLIYVTAFPDQRTMRQHLGSIAWETEVWIADAPGHLIHFNGHKFLGPQR